MHAAQPLGALRIAFFLILPATLAAIVSSAILPTVALDPHAAAVSSAPREPTGPGEQGGRRTAAESFPAVAAASPSLPTAPQARAPLGLEPERRSSPAHRDRVERPPRA
jgi:hypothetical protein